MINNNFEKAKRGAPNWCYDIYCEFNYSGSFLGFRSICDELSSRRRLFEWDVLFYEIIYIKWEIQQAPYTSSSHNVREGKKYILKTGFQCRKPKQNFPKFYIFPENILRERFIHDIHKVSMPYFIDICQGQISSSVTLYHICEIRFYSIELASIEKIRLHL